MKKLNLLDQSTNFKVNDTGTTIPFNAFEDKQPFGVTENETSVFRIKNDMGFLKAVNATSAAGGYIFQLNTKDLVGLVPGTYEIELVVTNGETNTELIFPDTGFCSFNITTSALAVTGTQIPTMSLDSFKQQLEQYVQTQTDTQTKQIKSDFDSYVTSVKTGPQGEPGPSGKSATVLVGTTKTVDPSEPADVTNIGTGSNAILNFAIPRGAQGPQGKQGVQGPQGEPGEKGDTGDIGNYCVSTGWLQTGLTYPNTASNAVGYYSIVTINGASVLEFYVSAHFKLSDVNAWGKEIFALPTNVTPKPDTPLFFPFYSNYGYGNLKYRNGQIIMNQSANIGNADSSGNVQITTTGRIPVTLNN